MRKIPLLLFALIVFIAAMCQDHNDPPMLKVQATLSGANEVPANQSQASGTLTGTVNESTRLFKFTVTYAGLTPSAGHIHKSAAGTNGPVIIPFGSLGSPIAMEITLTAEQLTDLKNNLHYVNLHTPALPGGEIRGQLAIVP